MHISRTFLGTNITTIKRVEVIQNYKLSKIMGKKLQHDSKKPIHNFFSYQLCGAVKVWIFCYNPNALNLKNIYSHLNHAFFDNHNKDESILYLKSKMLGCFDVRLSSHRIYNRKDHRHENLLQEEYDAFASLSKSKNNIIQETDKGTQFL